VSRVVYGLHPVVELLKTAPETVGELVLVQGARPARTKEALSLARAAGVRVRRRPRPELSRLAGSETHQGLVALVEDFAYRPLDRLLADPRPDLLLLLDSIQDPRNLGALARSALAAGVKGLIIPKDRAAPVTAAAVKASAGALSRLPVTRVTNLNRTAALLKEEGFWLLGASPRAEQSLFDLPDLPERLALAVGSEGKGLSRSLAEKCDFLVSLPLVGPVESLSAPAAAVVILYELLRRRMEKAGSKTPGANPGPERV